MGRLLRQIAALTLCLLVIACGASDQPTEPAPNQSVVASREPVDVPALRYQLPPQPRAFDTSDAILESELLLNGGYAFVGFKSPAHRPSRQAHGYRGAFGAGHVRHGLEVLRSLGGDVVNVYGAIGVAYVRLPQNIAGALRHHPMVDFIEPAANRAAVGDGPLMQAASMSSRSSVLQNQVLTWNVSFVRAPAAWSLATGSSTKLMMVGPGIFPHADLPSIPAGNCAGLINSCDSFWVDGVIHLGIIAAPDDSDGVIGIAKGLQPSNIIIWRVIDPDGFYDANQYISALNNAPGLGARTVLVTFLHTNYLQAEAIAISNAWAQGTLVVTGIGQGAQFSSDLYPANLDDVVAVSGVRMDSSFAGPTAGCNAPGSNWGPTVDFSAPFWALTTTASGITDTKAVLSFCSTQMAAAHVAGVLALIRDRFPTWTANQVLARAVATASIGTSRTDQLGYGIPNACWPFSLLLHHLRPPLPST